MRKNRRKGRSLAELLDSTALGILLRRRKEGTFGEILEDWRWILRYTKQYRWAVACYVVLGIASTSLSLISAVAGKYTIDIITGYQVSKLAVMAVILVSSSPPKSACMWATIFRRPCSIRSWMRTGWS